MRWMRALSHTIIFFTGFLYSIVIDVTLEEGVGIPWWMFVVFILILVASEHIGHPKENDHG